MVVGWNCSEFEASECKICLPYALVSSDSPPPPLNASRASTNLPFQTAGIERGSSRFSSLVSCKDVECMLRSGCSSPLGKLVRRVYVERESIKQALYWLWSLEPLPLTMIW